MTLSSTRRACAKCQVELRTVETGVYILEMTDFGPYKLWNADKWGCPECGLEILTGLGNNPMQHWEDGFIARVDRLKAEGHTVIQIL